MKYRKYKGGNYTIGDIYKIYVHINKINGKLYIGQTGRKRMKDRYGKDGYQYHQCTHFWRAIQKYGWDNFEHIVLIENISKEMANIIESELIKKYDTTNAKYGYNITLGGDGCRLVRIKQYTKFGEYIRTYESIMEASNDTDIPELTIRSSCANKGAFLNRGKYRWTYEDDELVEISTLHTRNKKINQFDLNGTFIKTWNSAKEIENMYGHNHSKIASCCRGRQRTAYGYIWRYNFGDSSDLCLSDDYHESKIGKHDNHKKRRVTQFDLNYNKIRTWDSITKACKELFNSSDISSICKCCSGEIQSAHGYKWKYADGIDKSVS